MPTATITSKGQTTIPKKVRELLQLNPGDKIDFLIAPDGTVTVRPATLDVRALYGVLYRRGRRPVSLEDMDQAIADACGEKDRRSRG